MTGPRQAGPRQVGVVSGNQVLLRVQRVTQRFGGVVAVSELDIDVDRGTITSVIGPNGAGKTTLFNCVTGIYEPTEGRIHFDGHDITGVAPHTVVQFGIARTFQNIRLFPTLTVIENVLIGTHSRSQCGVSAALLATPSQRREERDVEVKAFEILSELGMDAVVDHPAASLAYGRQRRLEIARALAADPKLLLLDEPAAGLNPVEKSELKTLVRAIRDKGITIVLIEHDMKVVMDISDKVVVLDYGRKISEGEPAKVRADSSVIEAYLGHPHIAAKRDDHHEEAGMSA